MVSPEARLAMVRPCSFANEAISAPRCGCRGAIIVRKLALVFASV